MGKKKIKGLKEKRRGREERAVSPEQILQLMEGEDRPLLIREILRRLDLQKEGRQKAKELLRDLADEGRIVKIRGNRYGLLTKMNLVVGKVKCHPDGYGFVIPEKDAWRSGSCEGGVDPEERQRREGHPDSGKRPPQGRGKVYEGKELFLSHPGG
jgi:ribonuclease R